MKVQIGHTPFILTLETRSKEAHTLLNKKPELREKIEEAFRFTLVNLDNELIKFVTERRY